VNGLSKVRVYDYAKQLNMSSKEILTILARMDAQVKSHMSVLDEGMIQKVQQFLQKAKAGAASIQTKEVKLSHAGSKSNRQQERGGNQPSHRFPQKDEKSASHANKPSRTPNQPGSQTGKVKTQSVYKPSSSPSLSKSPSPIKGNSSKPYNNAQHKRGDYKGKQAYSSKSKEEPLNSERSLRGNKGRKKRGDRRKGSFPKQAPVLPKEITVSDSLPVGEFAKLLRKEASEVIRKLIKSGIMATINQEIDVETMMVIGEEFDVTVKYKEQVDESNFEDQAETDQVEDLEERPPVVTIMGHVDHGKTTLLDQIRNTNVTKEEAGGITQHIGAYQVEIHHKRITFLDTPGHAAFTMMRARGASVTDITILVVAADDGVMPQTIEAINHAQAAEVPIIVAINKIDKPGANPDRIKQQLAEHHLVSEDWGGDTIFVPLSAKTGEGVDDLLEMVLLMAEVQEYKANPNRRARGVVIEAELDKGRGAVATVLIQNGTLKIGDSIVVGNYFGKIRAMINDRGRRMKIALPSTPVEILGISDVPKAGDPFMVFEDEKKGRAIAEKRLNKQREEERGINTRVTLDDLFQHIQAGQIKEFNVIIKADVQGSAEAIKSSLEKIEVEGIRVKMIHTGVGAITESDIILASASNAIIIGFNVRPEPNARAMAEQEKVDIRLHRVIYNAIEEIERAMEGMLDPQFQERVVGTAEIRQIFKVSKVGTIAGCLVIEGKVVRNGHARLIRDGIVIHESKLDTLKRFKEDVKEVAQGYECGLTMEGYNDIKEGDVIEVYVIEEIERS
jgi:translation initiation factor IF-2